MLSLTEQQVAQLALDLYRSKALMEGSTTQHDSYEEIAENYLVIYKKLMTEFKVV